MKFELCLVVLISTSAFAEPLEKNMRRQFPEPQQPYRRIDTPVIGSSNDNINTVSAMDDEIKTLEVLGEAISEDIKGEVTPVTNPENTTEEGFLDSYFGDGAQSRIVTSINNWVVDKAKTNPGCVERFICEAYRTGETLDGIPYFFMTLTNAAVSFMVAEMFDKSVDIKEITRAARYGRTVGTCHSMECEIMDNHLRNVSDYLGTFEDFISSIFNSISNSISIGK